MGFWQTLPRPIIGLAPMDGVSDAAFRLMVARHGSADVSFTEFTSVGDVCRGPDGALRSLLYHECERPIVAQLYGKDPELFYLAAHVISELGFDGLDINMGCPSRNVASSGSGAGLIRTPQRAHAILAAARQGLRDWAAGQTLQQAGLKAGRVATIGHLNVQRVGRAAVPRRVLPLSVKTRLGYDTIVIEDWVAHLLEARPAVISIHGRTLAQMYQGAADWTAIRRAVQVVQRSAMAGQTLVLGNGDVQCCSDVVRRVRESGVDGVLIGRGTLGAPWFFRSKEAVRRVCRAPSAQWHPDPADGAETPLLQRFSSMRAHAQAFESLFGVDRFPRMRKHLGWYCKGFPHAATLRAQMVHACSTLDVDRIVADYLSRNADLPSGRDCLAPAAVPCP
jgi:tRNA-dihydrouridine synthase